jgi:uncharacterized membrane protein YphA (DoxX/SURF4 family)
MYRVQVNRRASMSTFTFDGTAAASNEAAQRGKADTLRAAALAMLSIRFIQGFVYWGGGSRRFIYAPGKLDPNAANWMANKFQSAMPGALLGKDHIIAFLLHHFYLLYASLILFSAVELFTGLSLMAGFLTRAAALVSIGLSVVLMLMFGWQGATCIDEWTMAAGNLAIGATLMLGGSGAFSLDSALLARKPALAERGWFRWISGALPLPMRSGKLSEIRVGDIRGNRDLQRRYLQLLSRLGGNAVSRRPGQPRRASSQSNRWGRAAERRRAIPCVSRWRYTGSTFERNDGGAEIP